MSGTHRALRWAAAAAWAGLIFFLSSQSKLPYPKGFSVADLSTLGHLGAYFVLSLLLYIALSGSGIRPRRAALLAIALSVLYGLSDEFHQSFVPGRDASPVDLLVDTVAATLAAVATQIARLSKQASARSR